MRCRAWPSGCSLNSHQFRLWLLETEIWLLWRHIPAATVLARDRGRYSVALSRTVTAAICSRARLRA